MSASTIVNIRIGDLSDLLTSFYRKVMPRSITQLKRSSRTLWRWTVRKVRHICAFLWLYKTVSLCFRGQIYLRSPNHIYSMSFRYPRVRERKGIYSNWIALAKLYESRVYIESIVCIKMNTKKYFCRLTDGLFG